MKPEPELKNKQKIGETAVRQRQTNELDTYGRRLQSLARVLQGASECVAVVHIHGKFFIAANELQKDKNLKSHKQIKETIGKFMAYFVGLAKGEERLTRDTKIEWLTQLCIIRAKTELKQSAVFIPTGGIEEFVTKIVIATVDSKNVNFLRDHGGYAMGTGLLLGLFQRLYRDFCKLESFAADANNKSLFLSETDSNNPYVILSTASTPGIHAEVQLLEKLISNLEQPPETEEIVFGISKLCCLHCSEMLSVANNLFEKLELNHEIVIGGTHGRDFDNVKTGKEWQPPALFKSGYDDCKNQSKIDEQTLKKKDLAFQIGYLTYAQLPEKLSAKRPSGFMTASPSSSEPEATVEDKIDEIREKLKHKLDALKNMTGTIDENNCSLNLALLIIGTEEFCELYKKQEKIDKVSLSDAIFSIETTIKEQNKAVNYQEIVSILKDNNLFDTDFTKNVNNVSSDIDDERSVEKSKSSSIASTSTLFSKKRKAAQPQRNQVDEKSAENEQTEKKSKKS